MLAKLATYALVGIGYALVCIAVTIAIALPWLNAKGIQVPLGGNGIPATLAGVVAAVAIFGLIGVGLGALVREQVATVVGLLVYLFIAEPIVTRIPALAQLDHLPARRRRQRPDPGRPGQPGVPPTLAGRPGPGRLRPHPRHGRHRPHHPPRHHLTQCRNFQR